MQLSNIYKHEIRATFRLAVPIILAQLGVVLMGVTDNIMVGKLLGAESLGAAGLANSVAFFIGSFAVGGLPVIAPLIAKSFAQKDESKLSNITLSTILVGLFFTVLCTFISYLIYFNFQILDQKPEINQLSKPFYLIIVLSNIAMIAFISLKQLSDGIGNASVTLKITFGGLLLNILFNYVLIKGFLFIPALGLNGAAYSTLFVRIAMLMAIAVAILKSDEYKTINWLAVFSKRSFEMGIQIIKISIPSGLQLLFEIGAFSIAVVMMGWISSSALAAHQIAINIAATLYMMASGIGYAGGIRIGNALGKRSFKAVRVVANVSFTMVFIFMFCSMMGILVFKHQLIQVYVEDPAINQIAVSLLVIAAIFQLSDGIQVVALGCLRGLADVNVPAWITFLAYWLIALPLGYYLAIKYNIGAEGIWYGLLVGLSCAALLLTLRFYQILAQKMKKARKSSKLMFD